MDGRNINKCKSDQELKKNANNFFQVARDSYISQPNNRNFSKFRIYKNLIFEVNDDVLKAQHDLITRCVKLLGTNFGNEKEFADLARKIHKKGSFPIQAIVLY